uniref:Uncharacterized protein n=1 Tax=Strigamia maritima TaxID=126957 RepID=T1II12_STRMM
MTQISLFFPARSQINTLYQVSRPKMELITIKGISLGTVLIISLILGLAPLKFAAFAQTTLNVKRRQLYRRLISFLSCFGGGVFLAASLLDLLPDVRVVFEDIKHEFNIETNFPLVEFVVSIGFFIVFIIEQVVLAYKENSEQITPSERERLISQPVSSYNSIDDGSFAAPTSINKTVEGEHDHSSLILSLHEDPSSHSTLRTMILLTALSLHSIFEGLAIGLQSVVQSLLQLLLAVVIHKGIIALSLGVNLTQRCTSIRSSVMFTCTHLFKFTTRVYLENKMNARFQVFELSLEGRQVEEAVASIFHTLIFHRSLGKFHYKQEASYSVGSIGYEDTDCDFLDFTYVRCSSDELDKKCEKGYSVVLRCAAQYGWDSQRADFARVFSEEARTLVVS